ncbi:MAG: glutathione peroxidase [Proteobacteria bacterium]|nr:MAG: glutathione peroxidase [Pseudomonadota bacterium]
MRSTSVRIAVALLAVVSTSLYTSRASAIDCASSDIDASQRRLLGPSENICETYGGKVLLVANVASHCGFTPQYEGLEKLYRTYRERGLVVLGFPSGDFAGQEFEDEAEIAEFCKLNFGVSFPLFSRSSVKGPEANELFKKLIASTGEEPGWNFNKYLVGRDGKAIAHFPSKVEPDSPELIKAIEAALAQPAS